MLGLVLKVRQGRRKLRPLCAHLGIQPVLPSVVSDRVVQYLPAADSRSRFKGWQSDVVAGDHHRHPTYVTAAGCGHSLFGRSDPVLAPTTRMLG